MAIVSVTIAGNAAPLRNAVNQSESALGRFGGSVAKFAKIGAAAFAAAGAAAVVMGKKLINAGENAATANARIEQITQSMGLFGSQADQVSARLVKLAEKTALNIGVDQNIIKSTQAKLLTFGELAKTADESGGAFDRATKAALDLAAAGFGSASENAVQLGKALQDPIKGITALARSGVTFTEAEKERIRTLVESNQVGEAQALILEAIEKQVGGTAEATANATDKIRVAFSQVMERLGMALLPLFEKFSTFLIETVFPTVEALGNKAMPYITNALDIIGKVIEKRVVPIIRDFLIPAFHRLSDIFLDYIVPTIRTVAIPIFKGLVGIFDLVVKKLNDNRDSLRRYAGVMENVFGFVRDKLAPIFSFVLSGAFKIAEVAISGLLFAFFKIMDVVTIVYNFVSKIASLIVDLIVGLVNGVINAINTMIEGFNSLPSWLRFGKTIGTIGRINITMPSSGASSVTGGGMPQFVDFRPGMPTVPVPQIGGGGGGEGGGGSGGGGGGGKSSATAAAIGASAAIQSILPDYLLADPTTMAEMNITVNVNGAVATKAEIGDAVIQALRASQDLNGPLPLQVA